MVEVEVHLHEVGGPFDLRFRCQQMGVNAPDVHFGEFGAGSFESCVRPFRTSSDYLLLLPSGHHDLT